MNTTSTFRERLLGRIEYYRHPELLDHWGGPFNGQCFRQLMYLDLAYFCNFETIVETGTYRGSTTQFLAQNSGAAPVHSCELDAKAFEFAKWRLRNLRNVNLFNMDSREFIRDLKISRQSTTFVYLDAHWGKDLPLQEEVDLVVGNFRDYAIMIDDFEVPKDTGYGYDDYGPGKRLSLKDFPFHLDSRVACYFPARPSSRESGLRRGAIIVASLGLRPKLDSIDTLIPVTKIIS